MNSRMLSLAGLLAVMCSVGTALAANHYVRQGASGDGSDWTNAYGELPTALVRGDTYYIGTGTYGAQTLSTPNSGTAVITVKGATASDHGTDIGWSSAYSVNVADGGAQAQFPSGWTVSTDYWTVDGACGGGSANNGTTTGYGFRSRSDATGAGALGFTFTTNLSGIAVSHYEIDGVSATSLSAGTPGPQGMICTGGCNVNGLLDHLYVHDVKMTCFLMGGNVTLQYSYLARNRSTAAMHAEGWSYRGGTAIVRYNIFEDIRGTAQFVELYGTGTNHEVHGNVFKVVAGPCATECGSSAWPVVDNTGQGTINGLKFYNNTIYGLNGNPGTGSINGSTGYDVKNNLWVNNSYGASISGAEDYNTVWGTYWYGGPSGAQSSWRCFQFGGGDPSGNCAGNNNLVAPAVSAIFASAPANLHVLGNTVSGFSIMGVDLGAPYDVDMDGRTRTNWTRGAYECGPGTPVTQALPKIPFSKAAGSCAVYDILGRRTGTMTGLHFAVTGQGQRQTVRKSAVTR
jgi:hypothetical protein